MPKILGGLRLPGAAPSSPATGDAYATAADEYVYDGTIFRAGRIGYINHGATAGAARPSGYDVVEWKGSVQPTNAVDGDIWIDTGTGFVGAADLAADILQPGVNTGGDISRNSSSSINIASGSGWVLQASGLLTRVPWTTTTLASIPAAATNPRVDQFVVDSTGAVTRLAGSEQSGATLDNAAGTTSRAAVPTGSLRLGEALVKTSGGGIIGATAGTDYRDRRAWARGIKARRSGSGGGNYTTTGTSDGAVDTTNLQTRLECSGLPLQIIWRAQTFNSASGNRNFFQLYQDGATLGPAEEVVGGTAAVSAEGIVWVYDFTPTAGSHLFNIQWHVSAGTGTIANASAAQAPILSFEEISRPVANNGTA